MFEALPEEHYETAWTMCQIGRACFEMVKYPEAAQAFERARSLDPSRLEVKYLFPDDSARDSVLSYVFVIVSFCYQLRLLLP